MYRVKFRKSCRNWVIRKNLFLIDVPKSTEIRRKFQEIFNKFWKMSPLRKLSFSKNFKSKRWDKKSEKIRMRTLILYNKNAKKITIYKKNSLQNIQGTFFLNTYEFFYNSLTKVKFSFSNSKKKYSYVTVRFIT